QAKTLAALNRSVTPRAAAPRRTARSTKISQLQVLGSITSAVQGRTAHASPMQPGKIGSIWLSKRRWHRDRPPHPSLHEIVEFWDEGAPFRCFGPHTHRKAPVEARARFSEESCHSNYRIEFTAAQPDNTGRLGCNS